MTERHGQAVTPPTPEMISAGARAYEILCEVSDPLSHSDELVVAIYTAMAHARETERQDREPSSFSVAPGKLSMSE